MKFDAAIWLAKSVLARVQNVIAVLLGSIILPVAILFGFITFIALMIVAPFLRPRRLFPPI
jgi:hypothetical protein